MLTADQIFLAVVLGIFGLVIGSFLNVVIWRVPNKESLLGPSHCPKCEAPITWSQNIPLFSWLFLAGKCANCRNPISIRYPIVELITGMLFALVSILFSPHQVSDWFLLFGLLYFAAVSVTLAWIDADTKKLPDVIVLPSYGVVMGLLLASSLIAGNWSAFLNGLIGMVALFVFYFVLMLLPRAPMGFGDVKLAGIVGFILGYLGMDLLLAGSFIAFFLGATWGIVLMAKNKAKITSGIAFGPWIIAGFWLSIPFGHAISSFYLRSLGIR